MAGTPITIELKEQALMRLLPPYSWSLRQVADDDWIRRACTNPNDDPSPRLTRIQWLI